MQVRIGVRDTAREVVFESAQTPQQVRAAVSEALAGDAGLLELEDEKGATVLIPTPALGYVEIGAQEKGRVGFGSH